MLKELQWVFRAVLWGAWRRWGAESGKARFSIGKHRFLQVPGAPIWLPGGGAGSSGDDLRAPKSTLGVLGRRFRVLGGRFGATLKKKFKFWENFGDENRFRWKIYESGNTKYEIRNTKYEIRHTKYEIRNTKYEKQNTFLK